MLRIRDILVRIRICICDQGIRILIFSSVTLKKATNYFFSLSFFDYYRTFKEHLHMLDNRSMRIHTSD
jgi:hypothetical protein